MFSLYILWLGFKHLVNACISFISCSFGPLGRYLIIFASPGQWRWDLNILTNPVYYLYDLVVASIMVFYFDAAFFI